MCDCLVVPRDWLLQRHATMCRQSIYVPRVPRLAVRSALRNQVARGRGRSSHVVFTFAESLDVCGDFTRSQRQSAVNWPFCKFLMFASRGMTPCPNAFKKFSHSRTLRTTYLPTRQPCCWQSWQSSFFRVKARSCRGPQVGNPRETFPLLSLLWRVPVLLCFVMHRRCDDASCNVCPALP